MKGNQKARSLVVSDLHYELGSCAMKPKVPGLSPTARY